MAKAIIIEENNMLNNQTLETLRRLRLTGAVGPGSANPSRNKSKKPTIQTSTETAVDQAPHCSPLSWAERLKRVFDIDISVCRLCGGTLRVIADVTDPDALRTSVAFLGFYRLVIH